MKLIIQIILTALVVYLSSRFLPGVHVDGFTTSLFVAVVLGLLNTFLKPILKFISLPVTFMTLGLFLLVINAVLVLITEALVTGFHVDGFLYAVLFSIVISIITSILNLILD